MTMDTDPATDRFVTCLRSSIRWENMQDASRSDKINVLIVDDCCLYREGLASILAKESDIARVSCAQDWRSVVGLLEEDQSDVVLINLATAESSSLLTDVRLKSPASLVVAIGLGDSDQEIIACAEAGVSGFLLRSEPFSQLMKLVRSVVAGETACSPRASATLMRQLARLADERLRQVPVLTEREDQILGLLAMGLSNQRIAEKLGIELRTVKNHIHHIFGKLGVGSRGEAVAAMRSAGAPVRGRP